MVRYLLIAGILSLFCAVWLGVKPDGWKDADQKAAADVALMASLASQPDRVSWRLSEDVALRRALIWNTSGARKYPPPGGLVPLAYEFSDDTLRDITQKQQTVELADWSWFDLAETELLYCSQGPAVCLLYDRTSLEMTLDLQPGDLTLVKGPRAAVLGMGLLGIALLITAAGFGRAQRRVVDMNDAIGASGLQLIPERHVALRGALEVPLTPRDVKLLCALQRRDGAVVTKDELYDIGWGRDYMPNSRALDQHMINLRRKLDPDQSLPVVIETVRGVGYRLVP